MRLAIKLLVSLFIICLLLLGSACSFDSSNNKASFDIYLVKDLKTFEAINMDINKLTLEDTPVITDEDISVYIWEENIIKIKKDENIIRRLEDRLYMKVPLDGKPFVVVCNGKRIYLGVFWTLLSSMGAPNCPTIVSDFVKDNDGLKVDYAYEKDDTRHDKRIKEVFSQLGKLK